MEGTLPSTTAQWTLVGQNGFQDLHLQEDAPIPPLGDHDCLIKISAVALNFRDLAIAKNEYPLPISLPSVPTCDGAGTIIAVGSRVTSFKEGDRVCVVSIASHLYGRVTIDKISSVLGGGGVAGPLRQYAVYEDKLLLPVPKHLSLAEASSLPCAAVCAWNALYGGGYSSCAVTPIKPGDTVLTQGTGGVSLFAIQFALAAGATVIATTSASSGKKVHTLLELGVRHENIINYKSDPNWGETARKLTPNGVGVDHVIDIGGAGTLEQSLKAVRFEGTVSVIGFLTGCLGNGLGPGILSVLEGAITVRGVLGGSKLHFEELNLALERLQIKPVIDEKQFSFQEVVEAYKYLESGKHIGKVVIRLE